MTTQEETTPGDQEIVDHVDAVGTVELSTDVHLVEVFSLPRVFLVGTEMGLQPGEALDFRTGWDFDLQRPWDAAVEYIRRVKPLLVVGSPECTLLSILENLKKQAHEKEFQ